MPCQFYKWIKHEFSDSSPNVAVSGNTSVRRGTLRCGPLGKWLVVQRHGVSHPISRWWLWSSLTHTQRSQGGNPGWGRAAWHVAVHRGAILAPSPPHKRFPFYLVTALPLHFSISWTHTAGSRAERPRGLKAFCCGSVASCLSSSAENKQKKKTTHGNQRTQCRSPNETQPRKQALEDLKSSKYAIYAET